MDVRYGEVCSHSSYLDKSRGLSWVAILQERANISRGAFNNRQSGLTSDKCL